MSTGANILALMANLSDIFKTSTSPSSPPPSIPCWALYILLFHLVRFPSPKANMVFKYPTLLLYYTIKCPHSPEINEKDSYFLMHSVYKEHFCPFIPSATLRHDLKATCSTTQHPPPPNPPYRVTFDRATNNSRLEHISKSRVYLGGSSKSLLDRSIYFLAR